MRKLIYLFLILIVTYLGYKSYRHYRHYLDLKDAKESFIGKDAPSISATTSGGEVIDLAKLKEKSVVLIFWASWCPYCLKEIDDINRFYKANKNSSNIKIVSITLDEDKKSAEKIIEDKNILYPVIFDNIDGKNLNFTDNFKVVGVPSIWVIKKGKVVALNLQHISSVDKFIK